MISRHKLIRLIRERQPEMVAMDNVHELASDRRELINILRRLPAATRMVQVTGAGGAPLGAALLAGHGAGLLDDLGAAAGRWIRTGTVTEPDPRHAGMARGRIAKYASLLAALEPWSEG